MNQALGRRKKLAGSRLGLAVLLIGATSAIPAASSALAHHSRGATYRGTHVSGGTVEFDVSADGSAVTRFHVTNIPGNTCTFTFWTVTGTFPIGTVAPHSFSVENSAGMSFTGTFPGVQAVQGTFRVRDLDPPPCESATIAWNAATTTPWDTVAPRDPSLSSTSHSVGTRSRDKTIDVSWSGASDDWSGVDGFSHLFDRSPTTVPDTVKEAEETATGTTSPPLANGSWYLHLRTIDNAGNWTSTVHLGPFLIDTRCRVPRVTGKPLRAARGALAKANCRVGKLTRAYSGRVKKGRVISQRPRPGTRLPSRGKVRLVLSRGRRP
jgi:PASTA domain-containing protein